MGDENLGHGVLWDAKKMEEAEKFFGPPVLKVWDRGEVRGVREVRLGGGPELPEIGSVEAWLTKDEPAALQVAVVGEPVAGQKRGSRWVIESKTERQNVLSRVFAILALPTDHVVRAIAQFAASFRIPIGQAAVIAYELSQWGFSPQDEAAPEGSQPSDPNLDRVIDVVGEDGAKRIHEYAQKALDEMLERAKTRVEEPVPPKPRQPVEGEAKEILMRERQKLAEQGEPRAMNLAEVWQGLEDLASGDIPVSPEPPVVDRGTWLWDHVKAECARLKISDPSTTHDGGRFTFAWEGPQGQASFRISIPPQMLLIDAGDLITRELERQAAALAKSATVSPTLQSVRNELGSALERGQEYMLSADRRMDAMATTIQSLVVQGEKHEQALASIAVRQAEWEKKVSDTLQSIERQLVIMRKSNRGPMAAGAGSGFRVLPPS